MNQIPVWLAILQSTATTVGVLTAVFVAVWQVRKARVESGHLAEQLHEDRDRYERQMATLQRAEDDRIAGQARRIVPTVVRANIFGLRMWSVKVDNLSAGTVTELCVTVVGYDSAGEVVEDGCTQANDKLGTHDAFERVISAAVSGSIDAIFRQCLGPMAGMTGAMPTQFGYPGGMVSPQLTQQISPALQEFLQGQMAAEWPTTLTPSQHAVMSYEVDESVTRLGVTVTFTDEAGYRWSRTDNATPRQQN